MTSDLSFPPLLWGEEAGDDALAHAIRRAADGCDAGLISYKLGADRAAAAMVFAPEVPLARAMAMLPLCGVGFQNALGALAPPEVAVHLDWDGGIRVNGATCGAFRVRAATSDPDAIPDWLVIGWTITLLPETEETGTNPAETALFVEGCADVSPDTLVEAWARHTLAWINRWEDEGTRPLHTEWTGLAHGIGQEVSVAQGNGNVTGTFTGIDEHFGMLLRDADGTRLLPLTSLLETHT